MNETTNLPRKRQVLENSSTKTLLAFKNANAGIIEQEGWTKIQIRMMWKLSKDPILKKHLCFKK